MPSVEVRSPEAIQGFRLALAAWHGDAAREPGRYGTLKVVLDNGRVLYLHYIYGANGEVRLQAPGYDGHEGTVVYNPRLGAWLQEYVYSDKVRSGPGESGPPAVKADK
jgi:hypothetical protein